MKWTVNRVQESLKIAVVTSSADQGGANRALARLIRKAQPSLEEQGWEIKGFYASSEESDTFPFSASFRRPGGKLTAFRLGLRSIRRLIYRALGGVSVVSFADITTGLGAELRSYAPKMVIVNWLGDNTASLKEISSLCVPILWRLSDHWLSEAPYHFAPRASLTRLGRLREWVFCERFKEPTQQRVSDFLGSENIFLLAPSQATKAVFDAAPLKPGRTRLLPNTIDLEEWPMLSKTEARAKLSVPQEEKIVVTGASNILRDPRKGFAGAMHPSRLQLGSKLESFTLHVFGTGTSKGSVSKTEFHHGDLSESELQILLAAADVFVTPSQIETFGNTLLEALASGCPVVCFEGVGAADDLVDNGRNGFLVPRNDFKRLWEQAIAVLGDEAWLISSRNAARSSVEQYLSRLDPAKALTAIWQETQKEQLRSSG